MSVRQVVGAVVVAATGAVDLATAPNLQEAVTQVLAGGPSMVIIDLSDVDLADPAVYDMLCEADAVGVFQVEPPPSSPRCRGCGPGSFTTSSSKSP